MAKIVEFAYIHELSDDISELIIAKTPNGVKKGYRPAAPEPLASGILFKKYKCACGRTFRSLEDYKAHYIYRAVWDNQSGYIPSEIAKALKNASMAKESK